MEFPAILIDLRFLNGLPEVHWDPDEIYIKVAVHFGERASIRREYLQRYDVVFYERPPNKNYLLFHDEVPRIIPK
ncbi:unnamed protein product [Cylicostephanus goldi]|uniref:W02B3.4-like N-terminal domain-containing protein n=1 Tax=Cylicostephanus goldi TaxID=71465 RepID=A0A3P6TK42_CYLGO|nr:unnamed protein product [Cylicostephanus goldi]